MAERERYTHEVTITMSHGYIMFPIHAGFYGEGEFDEGIRGMLEELYPTAVHVSITEITE